MFKTQNFCHIASNNRNQVKAGVFVYRTTDDLATVSASGYFNERIIDINLHDIIIHEQIDASDATKVKQNFLCVVERTLSNVTVKIMDTDEVDGADTALSNLTATGYANISAKGTYDSSEEYTAGTVGAAIKANSDGLSGKVNIDGSSIMTGPLKMRAGSMQCAIAPYWDGVGFFELNSNDSVTLLASMKTPDGFCPATDNTYNIGKTNYKWKDLYVSRVISGVLNNGADIAVPTTGGTLALNDMSNLTSTGKNIANWSTNVSNCIVEMAHDILAGLSAGGTFTLHAGSKLYVPNGSGVFDEITVSSDATITNSANDTRMYFYKNGALDGYSVASCFSGGSAPSGQTYMFWYDTANNVVKRTTDGGSTWDSGWSLPFAVCTSTSGAISSVDSLFNGIGYVGSTIFALPGLKGLTPNGRNSDGTLKNGSASITSVQVLTQSGTYNRRVFIKSDGTITATNNTYAYNKDENLIHIDGNPVNTWCFVGYSYMTSDKITVFDAGKPFQAIDYNDTEFITHQALPSKKYIDLTLGASGDTYIMPADGWLVIRKGMSAAGTYLMLNNSTLGYQINNYAVAQGNSIRLFMPVSAGDVMSVNYDTTGSTDYFRFYYANGAK